MYKVFRVFIDEQGVHEYYWGQWEDAHTANEVALKLRDDGFCDSSIVRYVEE